LLTVIYKHFLDRQISIVASDLWFVTEGRVGLHGEYKVDHCLDFQIHKWELRAVL